LQDFRELNQNSHIDKYSMKELTECIGDIAIAAPLFKLTRKDSVYKGGPLPPAALEAFINL
jgi:hypothetical protein